MKKIYNFILPEEVSKIIGKNKGINNLCIQEEYIDNETTPKITFYNNGEEIHKCENKKTYTITTQKQTVDFPKRTLKVIKYNLAPVQDYINKISYCEFRKYEDWYEKHEKIKTVGIIVGEYIREQGRTRVCDIHCSSTDLDFVIVQNIDEIKTPKPKLSEVIIVEGLSVYNENKKEERIIKYIAPKEFRTVNMDEFRQEAGLIL